MDTGEGPGYRGGRGGGGRGGGWGFDNYRGGGRGGGGGGRGGYYNDGGGFQGGGYQGGGYQGGGGRGGGRYDSWHSGGRGGGYYNNDQGGGGDFRGGRGGGRGRGRYHTNSWGRGNYRNNTWERPREEEQLPADVAALTELTGHTNRITTIAYDPATQQLYTGSQDGTVRTWSTVTGQCVSSVEVGGEVDSLLLGGSYLFVGLHKAGEGIIKVWNMSNGSNHLLTGHKGAVLCMCIANVALVSGGQDNTIRVWNFNQQAGIFMSQAIITKEDGGHHFSVHAITVAGNYMFSADRGSNILVWDLGAGKSVQRIARAHADQPVMQLLAFDSYLLSAGMDGLVKAWQVLEQPMPGMVVRPDPEYVFDKENPTEGGAQDQGQMRARRGRPPPGIITISGTSDNQEKPILMVAYNGENHVRLYELPAFTPRGVLTPAVDTRALGSVPGMVMITGDGNGRVRIFQWK